MIDLDSIYLVDCFDFIKTLEDKSVDLVVTDPPYEFSNGGWMNTSENEANWNVKSKFAQSGIYAFGGMMRQEMGDFGKDKIELLIDTIRPKMKKMNCYFFCCEEQVPHYCVAAAERKLHYQILVWEKPLSIISKNRFSMNAEFVVRVYQDGCGLNTIDENEFYNRVMHDKPVQGKEKIHPVQKAVNMYRKFILLSSNEGDVVLDPFSGSGTCAVAALREKRHFICCEKNKECFNAAVKRLYAERSQLTLF